MSFWKHLFRKKSAASPLAPPILLSAINEGNLDTLKRILVESPTLVNAKDETKTVLYSAIEQGSIALVVELLGNKADPNMRRDVATLKLPSGRSYTFGGDSPLSAATREGLTEIMALLISHGANVNSKDHGGKTPLHEATEANQTEAVSLLLAHGAQVNAATPTDGRTPLHQVEDKQIAVLLLQYGADVNRKDRFGYSPLALAEDREGCEEVAELLRQHGGLAIHDPTEFEDEIKDVMRQLGSPPPE